MNANHSKCTNTENDKTIFSAENKKDKNKVKMAINNTFIIIYIHSIFLY